MKEITVYRYEDHQGRGMYTGKRSVPMELYDSDLCPVPHQDERLVIERKEKSLVSSFEDGHGLPFVQNYGFSSKAQLKRWVQKQEFHNHIVQGYQLKVFKVPVSKVALGRSQVVFDRSEARQVKVITGLKF